MIGQSDNGIEGQVLSRNDAAEKSHRCTRVSTDGVQEAATFPKINSRFEESLYTASDLCFIRVYPWLY